MDRSQSIGDFFSWLDQKKIVWALGASSVLYYNGYPVKPRDVDLFISFDDYEEVADHLRGLGVESQKMDQRGIYNTEGFMTLSVDGTEIDLIAGFNIYHVEGEYRMIFDEDSIDKRVDDQGVGINVMSLEDWYILYQLIPGREEKVEIIFQMLLRKKRIRWDLLDRSMALDLPGRIRESVKKLVR